MNHSGSAVEEPGRHVFISYSRVDLKYVERLIAYLSSHGFDVFHDSQARPGTKWRHVIEERIRTCRAFVVVMSPNADRSDWVPDEVTLARTLDRPILPLLLAGKVMLGLGTRQYEPVKGGRMPSPIFVSTLRKHVEDPVDRISSAHHVLDRGELLWTDRRLMQLRRLLAQAYPTPSSVLARAKDVDGFDLTAVNKRVRAGGVEALWTRLLDHAAAQGLTRPLLAAAIVAADRDHRPELEDAVWQLDRSTASLRSPMLAALGDDTTTLGERRIAVDVFLRSVAYGLPTGRALTRLLRAASDDIGPLPPTPLPDVPSLVSLLDERMGLGGKVPPVVAFLEYVAAHLGRAGTPLRKILDEIVRQLRVARAEHKAVRHRASLADPNANRVSVFIQMRADGVKLRPSVWVYQKGRVLSYKRELTKYVSKREAQQFVEHSFEKFGPFLPSVELPDIRFEFVVPVKLLHEAVERWRFPDQREIGAHSQVVVRSLERMNDSFQAPAWTRRSEQIDRTNGGTASTVTCLLDDDAPPCSEIVGECPHCCGITTYHVPVLARGKPRRLAAAIMAGLPVGLLHRGPDRRADLLSIIDGALVEGGLDRLPRVLLRRRGLEQRPERDLALLWDDSRDRPDDDQTLQSPRQQEGS